MIFTTSSLINFLKQFPKDLPISNELATVWEYPDELKKNMNNMSADEFKKLTIKNATSLNIFEGSWEKDTVLREAYNPERYERIKKLIK